MSRRSFIKSTAGAAAVAPVAGTGLGGLASGSGGGIFSSVFAPVWRAHYRGWTGYFPTTTSGWRKYWAGQSDEDREQLLNSLISALSPAKLKTLPPAALHYHREMLAKKAAQKYERVRDQSNKRLEREREESARRKEQLSPQKYDDERVRDQSNKRLEREREESARRKEQIPARAYPQQARHLHHSYESLASRMIGEAVVVPENVDEIMRIIARWSGDLPRLNTELKPYKVQFTVDDYLLNQYGALGRADAEGVVMHAGTLRMDPKQLRITIDHEMVHRGQYGRATAQGKQIPDIVASITGQNGKVDQHAYYSNPHELMAYARSHVEQLRQQGMSDQRIEVSLRGGNIGNSVAFPIRKLQRTHPKLFNRFLKHAMSYLVGEQS